MEQHRLISANSGYRVIAYNGDGTTYVKQVEAPHLFCVYTGIKYPEYDTVRKIPDTHPKEHQTPEHQETEALGAFSGEMPPYEAGNV